MLVGELRVCLIHAAHWLLGQWRRRLGARPGGTRRGVAKRARIVRTRRVRAGPIACRGAPGTESHGRVMAPSRGGDGDLGGGEGGIDGRAPRGGEVGEREEWAAAMWVRSGRRATWEGLQAWLLGEKDFRNSFNLFPYTQKED
jgi:hypothetical protein